mmetsp:Transcript_31911/g.90641  ORF Transcript_31911/g.90641 Transcript_31911/m.90641 type:complete len:214 (-) Transcript_31911:47-688(-)
MLRGCAVVAGPDVAFESHLEVAPLVVEVSKVIVAHPDALLDEVGFVARQQPLQALQGLPGLALRGVVPVLVKCIRWSETSIDKPHDFHVTVCVVSLLELISSRPQGIELQSGAGALVCDELESLQLCVGGVVADVGLEVDGVTPDRFPVHFHLSAAGLLYPLPRTDPRSGVARSGAARGRMAARDTAGSLLPEIFRARCCWTTCTGCTHCRWQ